MGNSCSCDEDAKQDKSMNFAAATKEPVPSKKQNLFKSNMKVEESKNSNSNSKKSESHLA